jgi:4-hydroxybenzoate polyprenyltransferase
MSRFSKIFIVLNFIKFHHSIFAFPFLLGGVILAPGWKELSLLKWIAIIVAMVSARSSAMGFNRLIDARIDALNPRTREREIPSGKISKKTALAFVIINSLLFIGAAFFINPLAFKCSFLVLPLLFGYSYAKRFTWACHYILGFVIGLAPSAGWVAVLGKFSLEPFLLSGALMFYIAGFDLLYATQDADFDKTHRIHSIPGRFGIGTALIHAKLSHVISLIFFILVGWQFHLNWIFWGGLVIIGILMFIEHSIVKKDDLRQVPMAFFHINSIISIMVGISIFGGSIASI